MRVAIVGSRSFPQLKLVEWFVRDLPRGVTIVSGGARGVDAAAEQYAKAYGLDVVVHRPNLEGCSERHEFTKRYYERNQAIVNDADLVVAFTEKDRGGTWDTIKRAHKAGKAIKVIRPCVVFPGEDEAPAAADELVEEVTPQKGAGPFQLRRACLGSYALRRKCYIPAEEWAGIVADKDDDPEALAARILPDVLRFFEKHKRLGVVHAVTIPPRSRRNLERVHPMELVAARVAAEVGCDWAPMFEPWDKCGRGRHAKHGEIAITPAAARYTGKVVWVLDDVYTTGRTMRSAVQALLALEVHAHGLAWVYIA